MLIIAFVSFIIAALGGLILLTYVLSEKNTPKILALVHGGFAILALILLIIAAFHGKNILWLNIGIFILIVLGGVYLFITDILGKKISQIGVVIHGLAAFIGILLLAIIIFT